jgi:hypothetical protein
MQNLMFIYGGFVGLMILAVVVVALIVGIRSLVNAIRRALGKHLWHQPAQPRKIDRDGGSGERLPK